jgi:hypothetical protein
MKKLKPSFSFMEMFFLEDQKILKIVLLSASSDMNDEDFKTQIIAEKEAVLSCKPLYILADARKYAFTISPELQEWHNNLLFPVFRSEKVQKLAIILSDDIFTQVSIEQLIEDAQNPNFVTSYFNTENDALKWLLP